MSSNLLLITIGPVQDFIAQARRTRDLWYGSHLLSELARNVARTLAAGGARLIFPALDVGDPELEPCFAPVREGGNIPPLSISNKILAEIPEGNDPAALTATAREELFKFWQNEASKVKNKCASILAKEIDEVWFEQVSTLLEFNAAWTPLNDYAAAREKLERGISARKNLRDFTPIVKHRQDARKSSLDGGRDSVLSASKERNQQLAKDLRLADGEELDAVGLIKRAGGQPRQFMPLVNVALSPWLDKAREVAGPELEKLISACEDASITTVRPMRCSQAFQFDAEVLLEDRWKNVFKNHDSIKDVAGWGTTYVSPLLKKLRNAPYPYIACLVADGDNMGEALAGFKSADDHRLFSRALSQFALTARQIVEEKHSGILIYAGGDDVLAFVPVIAALQCGHDLQENFRNILNQAMKSGRSPTLSVGLGIGHIMESMGELLEIGRKAERLAKHGDDGSPRKRNALALIVDKRSGGESRWRAQWEEQPLQILKNSVRTFDEVVSSRKVYEIARMFKRLPVPKETEVGDMDSFWTRVLFLEVQRLLSRAYAGDSDRVVQDVGLDLQAKRDYAELYREVKRWIERMMIVRTLAEAEDRVAASMKEAKV